MRSYLLSKAAEKDLVQIAEYGDQQFGIEQSDKYRNQLSQHFKLIAKQPYFFREVSYIHQGYRRSVCGSHSIYYKIENNFVLIVRVLGRQDFEG